MGSDILHLAQTFALKLRIAYGQNFVDNQNLWIRCAATANASLTYIPLLYRFTGVSRNVSTPANSTISSNFRLISVRLMPRIAPFKNTFSRPVSSGWNPVPTSSRLAIRPRRVTRPEVGSVMRLRILSKVLLPAPLRPMTDDFTLTNFKTDIAKRPETLNLIPLNNLAPPAACP